MIKNRHYAYFQMTKMAKLNVQLCCCVYCQYQTRNNQQFSIPIPSIIFVSYDKNTQEVVSWLENLPEAGKCRRSRALIQLVSNDYWCALTGSQLRAIWCSHCNLALRHPLSRCSSPRTERVIQPIFNQPNGIDFASLCSLVNKRQYIII